MKVLTELLPPILVICTVVFLILYLKDGRTMCPLRVGDTVQHIKTGTKGVVVDIPPLGGWTTGCGVVVRTNGGGILEEKNYHFEEIAE